MATERKRKAVVGIVIVIFIILTFLLFTFLKSVSGKNKIKYPPSTDCNNIKNYFKIQDGSIDSGSFKDYAELDEIATKISRGLGYYQCYCKSFSAESNSLCDMYTEDYRIGLALANTVTVLVSIVNIVLRTVNMKLIAYVGLDTESS